MNLDRSIRRVGLGALALSTFAMSALALAASPPAGAATTAELLYSTDGGTTWSSNVTIGPGEQVLVRQWFDNDGDDLVDDASLTTTRPDDLALVAGTTQLCLNPSTSDPATPDATELACAGSAAAEAAVWSGPELALAPTAGFYGTPMSAGVGPLAPGRVAYLNLRQAQAWFPSGVEPAPGPAQSIGAATAPAFDGAARLFAYTDASNTPVSSVGWAFAGSYAEMVQPLLGYVALDLLGQRWLNLDECHWRKADGRIATSYTTPANQTAGWTAGAAWMDDASQFTGATATGQSADAATPSCGAASAGWTLDGDASTALSLDVIEQRYLRLQQCRWQTIDPTERGYYSTIAHNVPGGEQHGTTTSDTPSDLSSWACGNPDPAIFEPATPVRYFAFNQWFEVADTAAVELDLLDPARARGYVEYSLQATGAPTAAVCAAGLIDGAQTMDQEAALEVDGTDVDVRAGTITVDWSQLDGDPCATGGVPLVDPIVGSVVGAAALAGAVRIRRRHRPSAA